MYCQLEEVHRLIVYKFTSDFDKQKCVSVKLRTMAISGILLSYFSNYAIKRKRYWVYVQRSFTFVEFCVIFKVNCKGKFLITYIFHDVFFLKSLYEVS